jgi:hypothetical protein
MFEMQGVRMMHCTIWTEGVREIVSARDSDVKFIVSDHPVTIYNHAIPPDAKGNDYPNEPSIALKGSQTIFPLNRDFCLILTNLEYAQNNSANPLEKRTFAGNYRKFGLTECSRRVQSGISPPAKKTGSIRKRRRLSHGQICVMFSFHPKMAFGSLAVKCSLVSIAARFIIKTHMAELRRSVSF